MPVVEDMAEMSPICSTIVASAIGIMVIIDVINKEELKCAPNMEKTVASLATGSPNHAASLIVLKSTSPKNIPAIYDTTTPMSIGMILIIPLPKMLHIITTTIAISATHQLAAQLTMADCERVSPIAIMIGPVTIGGKKRITLLAPNALINAARTK